MINKLYTINEIAAEIFKTNCPLCNSKLKSIDVSRGIVINGFSFKCTMCVNDFEIYGYSSGIPNTILVRFNDFKNKLNFSYLSGRNGTNNLFVSSEQRIVDKINFNNYNDFTQGILDFSIFHDKFKKLLILL